MAEETPEIVNKPPSDAFSQQKLKAWQPIMTPYRVIITFLIIGIAFIPSGFEMISSSNDIYESTISYDGHSPDVSCSISSAYQGKNCQVSFDISKDVTGPIYVYYELGNFYQNHRKYVSSYDPYQLEGKNIGKSSLKSTCQTSYENGSLLLNPCGLIANSLFTDNITLLASSTYILDESDIAWSSDKDKFKQVDGFKYVMVNSINATCTGNGLPSSCKFYQDPSTNQMYLYYYPSEDTTQYLYETYPGQISPILGVTDQHFMVWMRTAALPKFRKLYGKIHSDLKKGDTLTFNIVANYEVSSFDGSKSIVISNLGEFGGKNPYLGISYVVVGCICLLLAILFAIKQVIAPRDVASPSLLNWN